MQGSGRRPFSQRRKRGLIRLAIAVAALAVVLVVASMAAAEYTSSDSFCHSCHEMDPYFASRQASAHQGQAACKDCHIPHGPVSFLRTKAFALREVYVHVTGQVKMPLTVTRRVPDGNCTSCHKAPGKITVAGSAFDHALHKERCVTCHTRVTHQQVPVAADYPASVRDPATMAGCLECHDGAQADGACATCHEAPHVAMGACDRCHGLKDWTPSAFDHPFALTGAHADLTCDRCHPKDAKAGRIEGTELSKADKQCASCHEPPHAGYGDCTSCHAATAWTKLTFTHPAAILSGKHASVTCTRCHPRDAATGLLKGTTLGKARATCLGCHGDHHGGLRDCARCHTPKGWSPADFSHPAAGEHGYRSFSCRSCHPQSYASASCTCHGGSAPVGD